MERRIWLINHNGSADLYTPIHPPRETRKLLVLVVQRRQRSVQKRMMHLQSCCFLVANLNLFLLPFSRSPASLLLKNGP